MASLEDDNPSASEEEENEDQDEDMEDQDDNQDHDETMADADNDDDEDNEDNDNDDDDNQDDFDDSPLKNRPRIPQRGYSSAQISTRDASPGNEDSDNRVRQRQRHDDNVSETTVPTSKPARIHRGEERPFRPTVKEEAVRAKVYDIVPTIAAPHSTSINAITATPDMKWVFSGGSDGWIRKFNWPDTVNSRAMLTVAQRHPFVDSVVKAGVLTSYWENEEPPDKTDGQAQDEGPSLSPVYSLAVHHQALWLLSGTEVGAINLMAVRHGEGKRITSLWQHSSAVSVLKLSHDELGLLSGSWDKTILDWDLNTGKVKRSFTGSASQISSIEMRPVSNVPVPTDTYHQVLAGTSTAAERKAAAQISAAATAQQQQQQQANAESATSPMGSLFGGDDDSLFGDANAAPSGGGGYGDDDDDEFSRAIANETQQERHEQQQKKASGLSDGETAQSDSTATAADHTTNGEKPAEIDGDDRPNDMGANEPSAPASGPATPFTPSEGGPDVSEQIFMDSAIDGTIRVWDRRQQSAVARIVPGPSVPPWCTSAVWSPDGCFIYAGRRNNIVEEYSLHKGLKDPTRTLKLPVGSGAVSALHPMANGKNLLCASFDILRLYDLTDTESERHGRAPFLIVPGHRTGVVSQLYVDPTSQHLISTGGTRGWAGSSTEVLLGYEIIPN